MYDVLVIGAGPAGVNAAIYCARAGLNVSVFEKYFVGGQASTTTEIENYLGYVNISGADFSLRLNEQLEKYEINVIYDEVTSIDVSGKIKKIFSGDKEFNSPNIVIATGAKPRLLGIKGEDTFKGKGVSYCATCDGAFFKNKTVAVVGGGNTALNDVLYLSSLCNKVYLIHRRDSFRGDLVLQEKVKNLNNVSLILNDSITQIYGNVNVEKISLQSGKEILCDGVFVAIGTIPQSAIIPPEIQNDDDGYIIVDNNMCTNVNGVYAVGDIRSGGLKQIISAAADGAKAADFICNHK